MTGNGFTWFLFAYSLERKYKMRIESLGGQTSAKVVCPSDMILCIVTLGPFQSVSLPCYWKIDNPMDCASMYPRYPLIVGLRYSKTINTACHSDRFLCSAGSRHRREQRIVKSQVVISRSIQRVLLMIIVLTRLVVRRDNFCEPRWLN